ncbi:glycosyltransferase [Bacillus sp. RO3]|nr:glycosyltransferase [Bacillus sp. RO3]
MAKTETIAFNDFMNNERKDGKASPVKKVLSSSGSIALMTMPRMAMAASADATFGNVHGAIMNVFDAGVVLVIIFAGASWGLGHRTKAIEILIGVCCGYILARHAVDIRDFLKGI